MQERGKKMKTVYYAEDGKRFDDEYECKEYENNLTIKNLGLVILDEDFNKLTFDEFDSCKYIKISDKADPQKTWDYIHKQWGWDALTESGCFFMDFDKDEYVNIDTAIKYLQEQIEILEKAKRMLNS
jgi:hypothetical protein